LKAFSVDMKAFLGLVLPNQYIYCHIVMQGIVAGFKVTFIHGAPPQSLTSLL